MSVRSGRPRSTPSPRRRRLGFPLLASAASLTVGALAVSTGIATASGQHRHASVAHAARSGPPRVGIFTYHIPSSRGIDIEHETVTLPLHRGLTATGKTTWYVVTDSSQRADATRRGVNFAGKLGHALGTAAVQHGRLRHGTLVFPGTVNFGLREVLVPGPGGFPPKRFAPGAQADRRYSPLVQVGQGAVIDAPQIANSTGRSASVVAINYRRRTVTLNLLAGFVDGQLTFYLHTDASSKLVAALEHSTYTPNLNAAPGIGSDQPPSARAAIIPIVNGITGRHNPMRQGLNTNLLGQGDPLNVPQEQPADPIHYTPVWDVTPVKWTAAAIASGQRVQLHSQDEVRQEALAGNLVSALPGTPDAGLGGLNASGAISNCPIIAVFPG